jgi:hypothetical protein
VKSCFAKTNEKKKSLTVSSKARFCGRNLVNFGVLGTNTTGILHPYKSPYEIVEDALRLDKSRGSSNTITTTFGL